MGQNGWAPGWLELVGWGWVPWVCTERVCSAGVGRKRVGCNRWVWAAGDREPKGVPPLSATRVALRMDSSDGLVDPRLLVCPRGLAPGGEFQVGGQSAVGLSRLGPKGWVSGGGPYRDGNQEMGSKGWSPRVGPQGVGPRVWAPGGCGSGGFIPG